MALLISLLAQNLRRIREEKNVSMKELGEKSDLSVAQISKLENGKADPSVSSLMRLASVLNVSVAMLLAEDTPKVSPLRKGEGYPFRRYTGTGEPVIEIFLNVSKDARMQPEIITLPPKAESGPPLSHNGEEFFYVLEGSADFFYGAECFPMEQGDFLYFDNTVPHRWINTNGEEETRLLVCCSPPVF